MCKSACVFVAFAACAFFALSASPSEGGACAAFAALPSHAEYAPALPEAIAAPAIPSRAEQVMRALAAAYSAQISAPEMMKGDWTVLLRGRRYYYAEGRLLPEELRERWRDYTPQPFYTYPRELAPWHAPSAEDAERFRQSDQARASNPPRRSQHFFDDLWRAHSREESYERLKTIRFLGHTVLVHHLIMEELALIEERLRSEARTNPQVAAWIGNLSTLDSWSWRNIADTQTRSFHAYGTAIDLLPRSRGGLETYWLWTRQNNPEWWAVPYSRRLHPPDAVIRVFEDYGFIWGGKWMFFDTMHFEYRPEILLLSNIPLVGTY